MAANREQIRQQQLDQNARNELEREAIMAELRAGLFALLEAALRDNAPLLLHKLQKDCKQDAPYNDQYDGKKAWLKLFDMSKVSAMLPGEDIAHDAEIAALALKPLPKGASADEFSQRVGKAMKDHIPYLERPFSDLKLSQWVLRQAPSEHYNEALRRFNALTTAEQKDAHGVAAMVVDVIAENRDPLEMVKATALGELVANLDDSPVDPNATGRRPFGLGKGNGRGGGGRGGGGGGRGGGRGGPSSESRATSCSTPAPRGPMCTNAHKGPCWRDPTFTGPLPWRVFSDAAALAQIKADRLANGRRLGEPVLELKPTPKPDDQVVAMLEEDPDDLQQWPFVHHDDEDVPRETLSQASAAAAPAVAKPAPPSLAAPTELSVAASRATAAVGTAAAAPASSVPVTSDAPSVVMTDEQRARAATNRAAALQTLHRNQLQQAQQRAAAAEDELRAENARLAAESQALREALTLTRGSATDRAESEDAVPLGTPVETLTYHQARRALETLTPDSPLAEIRRVIRGAGLDSVSTYVGGGSPSRVLPGRGRSRLDILVEARAELNISTPPGWGRPATADSASDATSSSRSRSPSLASDLARAVYTLRVLGQGGDVPNLGQLTARSVRTATTILADHGVVQRDWGPAQQQCGAWLMQYAAPPPERTVHYVGGCPQRRHALGLLRLLLLQRAGARGSSSGFGDRRAFIAALPDLIELYRSAVVESLRLFDENGGDHDDADHAALVLPAEIPADAAFLAPLRPDPESVEGVSLAISERLHAAAAPYARFALVALVSVLVVLFHGSLEACWALFIVLLGHIGIHARGGHGGEGDDAYDYNVSLFTMATNPPNVLEQAARGNVLASGIMITFVMIVFLYRRVALLCARRLWRLVVWSASETTIVLVLIFFVWVCVWKASALEVPSDAVHLQRRLLPAIVNRVDSAAPALVHFNINLAHNLSELVYRQVFVDFENPVELVAILGSQAAINAKVWDSGSRRHVIRDRSRFVQSTIKPCNFRIRGVHTGGKQPACMGDVDEVFPLCGGDTITHRLRDAVLIEEAPHDIIGAGLLRDEGLCDWRGQLPDGREVYLENHRFLLMPHCSVGQTTHSYDSTANGVLFVGGNRGLEVIPPKQCVNKSGVTVDVEPRPLSKGLHWSTSPFADDLRAQGVDGARECLARMQQAHHLTITLGPHPSREASASHYLSRAPYWQQYIDEHDSGRGNSNSDTVSGAVCRPSSAPLPSGMIYWFSGTDHTTAGVKALWRTIARGECVYRDTKLDPTHTLLNDEIYHADMRAIHDGLVTRGLFSVPCGTFSVSRYRPHPRVHVLREAGRHIHGLPDLSATDRAAVKTANVLVERTCEAVRALSAKGGLWIVENPVRRNDPSGPWKRFNSGKFPNHGSLWQMPEIGAVARDLRARVAHVPLCWFERGDAEVSAVEQKYITFMYPPQLEPALGFLRLARCTHLAHAKLAVGFDHLGNSLGEATGRYPDELNRILVRALAHPDRCASDEAWAAADVLAGIETVASSEDVPPQPAELGITGDRRAEARGAKVARGHGLNMRLLTSRQVHEMFVHKPAEVLRLLPTVCHDVPSEWANLKDLNEACPDCLAGKHTHFGSHSSLPDTKAPGEIVAFDLLILRTPDLYTSGTIVFGAIDLFSDWDVIIKIKFKTDVPECMREVVRIFKSYGHNVLRMHTDGEAVFHSDDAFDAIKSEMQGIGCVVTTGADYDHRQNSKIERHFRRLGDDARPGFLQSGLDDRFYQAALVDASAKHKLLPLARVAGHSPTTLMTGKPGSALPHRPFGTLGYVMLEHELNDSTVKLNKAHARAEPGILLGYGVTGVLRDRRVPAWALYVPTLRRNVPFLTPHCTMVLGCYPGVDGLRGGLANVLRARSSDSGDDAVHMDISDDGAVTTAERTLLPKPSLDVPAAEAPATEVDHPHHAAPLAPSSPTIAQRLSRRTAHPHEGSNRVSSALDFDAAADDSVLCLEEHPCALRGVLPCASLHPSVGGTADPSPFAPHLQEAPWLSSPGGEACKSDEEILVADLDVEADRRDELVLLCDDSASDELRALNTVRRHVTQEAPRRVVRFPWGDVPSPWVENYSTIYETGIDDSVFVLDESILTSLVEDDDPTWEQAIATNDSQEWYSAADKELDNLERFGVFKLVPADAVPCDEDIFDLMLLCKKKRGQDNVCIKHKVRCVLCGNQMVQSAKRGLSKTTADMRTHSPAVRAASLKTNFAVGVLDDLRMLDFDVDAAYLQGQYIDRRVFARAPKYYRRYDERGVELVWHLQRALYGGPDSGRVWYNTFAHYLMNEETTTPFKRCHFEPCTFTHFRDGEVDANGRPQRIVLSVYVDDGRTWDNCNAVCDAFYERLKARFSITMDGASKYMIGMDISLGEGWLSICSSTYIRNMCERFLDYPIGEYDYVGTPAHPKLLDFAETAFLTRGNTPPELATRYRSLVGALIFPAPTTRPDCLYTVGILARAMDCATEDMYKCALYCLVYMGQTHKDGITYLRDAPGSRRYEHWSDSDWGTRRSTTGGTGPLAGGSVQAVSRRQDCTTGSSTHAEIVAASANSNDVVWARGYLGEIGLPQEDGPTQFFVDAANVITLVHNLISSKATRHITRRECVVREREADGTLTVTKVGTNDNLADLFTKALARDPFTKLRKLVMNILAQGAIAPVPRARRLAASRGA